MMEEEGVGRLLGFWGLKKSGVVCGTSPIPQGRRINLPQMRAGSALPAPSHLESKMPHLFKCYPTVEHW